MTAANVWLVVAIVGFVLSGLSLIAAIVIFLKFRIPAVMAELSGKTVVRGIKEMQNETATENSKKSRFSLEREDITGKIGGRNVDKNAMALAHESKRLDKTTSNLKKRGNKTDNLTSGLSKSASNQSGVNYGNATEVMPSASGNTDFMPLQQGKTEVMSDYNTAPEVANGTAVLSDNATAILNDNGGTAVLGDNGGTAVLSENTGTEVLGDNGTEVLSNSGTSVLNGTTVLGGTSQPLSVPTVAFTVTRTILEIHTDEVI